MTFVRKLSGLPVIILIFCIAVMGPSLASAETEVVRLSEPVAVTDGYEFYGATLPDSGKIMSLRGLIIQSDEYLDKEVMVETRIAKVCQKKGCFFVATEGATSARITFKDYGFFIPTDSGGKTVTLLGVFSRVPISKEQAEHYSADLGEPSTAPTADFEYSIVASAIRLPTG